MHKDNLLSYLFTRKLIVSCFNFPVKVSCCLSPAVSFIFVLCLGFITFSPDYFHDLFCNSALQNLSELIKTRVMLGRNGWLRQMLVKETVLYWLC